MTSPHGVAGDRTPVDAAILDYTERNRRVHTAQYTSVVLEQIAASIVGR